MRNKIFQIYISIVLSVCFIVSGCSEDTVSNGTPTQKALVQGRVTDGDGYSLAKTTAGIEGATITLARFEQDGSISIASTDSVVTAADGSFLLESSVENESGLVVIAEKDTAMWMARLSATVKKGEVVQCQPHTTESTQEAEVYKENVEQNIVDETSQPDEAALINADVAIALENEPNADALMAAALETQTQAHTDILLNPEIGATIAELEMVRDTKHNAQINLESSLFAAAENQAATAAAVENYQKALINAYVNAEISANTYAKVREISTKVLMNALTSTDADLQFRVNQSASMMESHALEVAAQTAFSDFGATNSEIVAVTNAAIALRASISAAETAQEISQSYEAFKSAVITALSISASSHAAAITTINTSINGTGGVKAILETALAIAITPQSVINAYLTFFNSIETLVTSSLISATPEEVQLISEALILINMNV